MCQKQFGDGSKFQSRRWGDLNTTVRSYWYWCSLGSKWISWKILFSTRYFPTSEVCLEAYSGTRKNFSVKIDRGSRYIHLFYRYSQHGTQWPWMAAFMYGTFLWAWNRLWTNAEYYNYNLQYYLPKFYSSAPILAAYAPGELPTSL